MSAPALATSRPAQRGPSPSEWADPVSLAPAKGATPVERANQALIMGDLSRLTPEEKLKHYLNVCESTGLNPATTPFAYCSLRGSGEKLYALKGATDQLRKINGVSIEEMTSTIANGILTVKITVKDAKGRIDCDIGAVPVGNLQGDNLANATMKAVTKAKRRATLSICGLGFLDESELDTIPDVKTLPGPTADQVALALNPPMGTEAPSEPEPLPAPSRPAAQASAQPQQPAPAAPATSPDAITKGQQETIGALLKEVGTTPDLLAEIKRRWGPSSQMTFRQAEQAIAYLACLSRIAACVTELGGMTPKIMTELSDKFGITNFLQVTSENGQGIIELLEGMVG